MACALTTIRTEYAPACEESCGFRLFSKVRNSSTDVFMAGHHIHIPVTKTKQNTHQRHSNAMGSADEFDHLDSIFAEFTEEDWAYVDGPLETPGPVQPIPPSVPVTPQTSPQPKRFKGPQNMQYTRRSFSGTLDMKDLFSRFRYAQSLSVSDLVGPSWCEVKFDYGLRWGRKRDRVHLKPDFLTTAKGKRIEVRKDTAQRGEAIMAAGTAIHKELELALQPTEITMPVNTQEERWGSKLLTMLSCLQLLRTVGYCREFPVMGFVDGIMVIGVIDEIVRKPWDAQSPEQHIFPPKNRALQQQTLISQFFRPEVPANTRDAPPKDPKYTLQIIDNKTRSSNLIPSTHDQQQSRLQLMLYRRLLDQLIHPVSFVRIMEKLPVDLFASFSPSFIQSQEYICTSNDLSEKARSAMSISSLIIAWKEALGELDIGIKQDSNPMPVSPIAGELKLVYRLRARRNSASARTERGASWMAGVSLGSESRERGFGVDLGVRSPSPSPLIGQAWPQPAEGFDDEDHALAWAIQESLKVAEQNSRIFGPGLESGDSSLANTLEAPGKVPEPTEHPSLGRIQVPITSSQPSDLPIRSREVGDHEPPKSPQSQNTSPKQPAHVQPSEMNLAPVVGVSAFQYDVQQLDQYLEHIMLFWRGKREPIGVDVEDSNRCNFCEFRDGCEWREFKATEFGDTRRERLGSEA